MATEHTALSTLLWDSQHWRFNHLPSFTLRRSSDNHGVHLAFPSLWRREPTPTASSLPHIFSCSDSRCGFILYPMSQCHGLGHHSSLRPFLTYNFLCPLPSSNGSFHGPGELNNHSPLFSEQSKTHHETNYKGLRASYVTKTELFSYHTTVYLFIRYTSLQETVLFAGNQEYMPSAMSILGANKTGRLRLIPVYWASTSIRQGNRVLVA
jgi:hypothetical protein